MLSSVENDSNVLSSEDETDVTLTTMEDNKAKLSLKKIKYENDKLLSQNKNLELENTSLKQENENLKEKISNYDNYFNDLMTHEDTDYLLNVVDEKTNEIEQLTEEIDELNNKINEQTSEIKELRLQIEIMKEDNINLNDTLIKNQEAFKVETDNYFSQIINLKEEKQNLEEKYHNEMVNLNNENKKLIEANVDFRCMVQDMKEQHKKDLANLSEKYSNQFNSQMKYTQNNYEKEITQLKIEKCKIENEKNVLLNQIEKINLKLKNNSIKNDKLRDNLEKLGENYKNLQNKNKELIKIIEESKINENIFNDPSFQENFCPNKFIFLFEKSPTISSRFNLLNKFVGYYTKQIQDIKNENKVLSDKLNVINKQRRNLKEQQKKVYHHSKSSSCLIQGDNSYLAKTSLEIKDLDDKMKPYLREILTQMKSKVNFLIEENKTFKKQSEILARINEELLNKAKSDQVERDKLGKTLLKKDKKICEYQSFLSKCKNKFGSAIYNQFEYFRNKGSYVFNKVCDVLSTEDQFIKKN